MFIQIALAIFVIALHLFRKKLSLRFRSYAICVVFFIAGVGGLLSFGLAGAGTMLLIGCCTFASLLIHIRAAIGFTVMSALVISSQLILAILGKLSYNIEMTGLLLSTSAWLNNLLVFGFLVIIPILLIDKFLAYLHRLLANQAEYIEAQSEKLSNSESILSAVVNSLTYGVLWKDNELRYLGANKYYLKDINVTALSDIVGKTDDEISGMQRAEYFASIDRKIIAGNSDVVSFDEQHTNAEGETVYISVSRRQLCSEDGRNIGILASYYDITERKNMEFDLLDAKQTAEQANLAKSQFLANMSHEIRTPLNGVMGLIELCLDTTLSDKQQNYLTKANLSAKTLLHIINDVLDISKIEAEQVQIESVPFSLQQILGSIEDQFLPQAKSKNIDFNQSYFGPDNLWVKGDPTRLLQILMNLCGNAIKFTEQGSVSCRCDVDIDGATATLTYRIQDSGVGIDEQVLPNLFRNFTQADNSISRKFGGTGLGLYIVKLLLKLMNGEVNVQSKLGEGTCFEASLKLPVCRAQNEASADTELVPDLTAKRILLVEDNDINRLIAIEILSIAGANVVFAVNGQEAINKLETDTFDVVLMDIQMPVMDGCEAMSIIRATPKWDTLTVIALTANAMTHEIEQYRQLGFNDHVAKPFDHLHLLQVVASYC
ncbi:ATP-binding protein [Alteromonadaceae bacterium BrNp21-10]|nr:ATP-binding protein [Alteromonadaceae bacterium BrNp21-10]